MTTQWNITLAGYAKAAPSVAADGTVFAGDDKGNIYAVNGTTGDVKWTFTAAGACSVTPAIFGHGYDMVVIAGCMNGVVYCLNATTGSAVWTRSTDGAVYASVVVTPNGIAYVCSLDTQVYAFWVADGSMLWNFATTAALTSPPAVADASVYVLNSIGDVYALERSTGILLWTISTYTPVFSDPPQSPVATGNFVYITTAYDIRALFAATGKTAWTTEPYGSWSGTPALMPDGTLVGAATKWGFIAGLSSTNGSLQWNLSMAVTNGSGWPSVDGNEFVYAATRTQVAAVPVPPPAKGKFFAWACLGGGSIAIGNGVLLVAKSNTLAAVARAPAPNATTTEAWVTMGHDATHTGHSRYAGPPATGNGQIGQVWKTSVGGQGGIVTSPVIGADGTVYVGGYDKVLYAIEPGTARIKWFSPLDATLQRTVSVGVSGQLFVATAAGVVAMFAENGTVAWRWKSTTVNCVSMEVGGQLYVGTSEGVSALAVDTGKVVWAVADWKIGGVSFAPSVTTSYGLVLWLGQQGQVVAADANSGLVAWQMGYGGYYSGTLSASADGSIGYTSSSSGTHAWDVSTGSLKWSNKTFGSDMLPALATDGTVYVALQKKIAALDVTGKELWVTPLSCVITTAPTLDGNGTLYVGGSDANVYAINASTGLITWVYTTGGPITTPPAIGADGTVIVGTQDTNLYALGVVAMPASPWPMRGHDALHTGRSPVAGPAGQAVQVRWKTPLGASVISSPVIASNGDVFVGSSAHGVYKVHDGGGTQCIDTTAPVTSSPAILTAGAAYVYAASLDGNVYAFMPGNCQRAWAIIVGVPMSSSPVISGSVLYIGAQDANVYAFDTATGGRLWNTTAGGPILSSPAVTKTAVIVGSNDGSLYAFATSDGRKLWAFATGGAVTSSPAIGGSGAAFVGSASGKLFAIDVTDGQLRWTFVAGAGIASSPALSRDGSTVVVGANNGKVYAISTVDGKARWTFETTRNVAVVASPAIGDNDIVYIGANDAYMYALDVHTGALIWRLLVGGSIQSSAAIAQDGTLVFGCNDGYLYALVSQLEPEPAKT